MIAQPDNSGNTVLSAAHGKGNSMIKYLVQEYKAAGGTNLAGLIDQPTNSGNTALTNAAIYGNLFTIQYLVQEYKAAGGTNLAELIAQPDNSGNTLLQKVASSYLDLKVMQYLVQEYKAAGGTNLAGLIAQPDNSGTTVLMKIAARYGNLEIIQYLVQEYKAAGGTNLAELIAQPDNDGDTVLQKAYVSYKNPKLQQYLMQEYKDAGGENLAALVSPQLRGKLGYTELTWAAEVGDMKTLLALVKEGHNTSKLAESYPIILQAITIILTNDFNFIDSRVENSAALLYLVLKLDNPLLLPLAIKLAIVGDNLELFTTLIEKAKVEGIDVGDKDKLLELAIYNCSTKVGSALIEIVPTIQNEYLQNLQLLEVGLLQCKYGDEINLVPYDIIKQYLNSGKMVINKATIEFYDNNPQYKVPGSYLSELTSNLSLAENHKILVDLLQALSNEDSLFVKSLTCLAGLQNTKLAELIKVTLDTVESFSIEEVEDVNEIVLPLVLTPEELVAVTLLVTAQGDDDNIVPLSGVNPVNEE